MKKLLTVGLVSLGLLSGSVFAENYQTSKHNIQISKSGNGKYIYRVWNKPKQIGQGKPDMELTNGDFESGVVRGCGVVDDYSFGQERRPKGGLYIQVSIGSCSHILVGPEGKRPKNSVGSLYVSVGKKESVYWLYSK